MKMANNSFVKKSNFEYEKTINYTLPLIDEDNIYNASDLLEIIKKVDATLVGTQKICYLRGFQANAEDSGFPNFFEICSSLKRECDATAKESLYWLIDGASEYNTKVSIVLNFTWANKESNLYELYRQNDLLLKNNDGNLLYAINSYGNAVNLINISKELECGFLNRRLEKLNEIIPLKKLGTVLIEDFKVRPSIDTDISLMKQAREKIVKLINKYGADVCLDYLYFEKEDGENKESLTSLCPFIFNLSQSLIDYMKRPASYLCGGKTTNLYKECESKNMHLLFGESVDIASIYNDKNFSLKLFKEFCTKYLKYRFLNGLDRLSATIEGQEVCVNFSKNVVTYLTEDRLTINGVTAKQGNELVLPTDFIEKGSAVVYTEKGGQIDWNLSKILGYASSQNIELLEITKEGLSEKKRLTRLNGGMLELDLEPGKPTAFLITRL